MYRHVEQVLEKIDLDSIASERKKDLEELSAYIQNKINKNEPVFLNFICTHNSRRSQFAQLWAKVAADHYGIEVESFSGGVEVTEFNPRAIDSINRFGFHVKKEGVENPNYLISWTDDFSGLKMYSKLYDSDENPSSGFAAIMTCSHADENCPYVTGCEQRFAIRYEDPKEFDDTPLQSAMYDSRSFQIATEMFYVFSKIEK